MSLVDGYILDSVTGSNEGKFVTVRMSPSSFKHLLRLRETAMSLMKKNELGQYLPEYDSNAQATAFAPLLEQSIQFAHSTYRLGAVFEIHGEACQE